MLGPIYALFVQNVGGDLLDASFAASIFGLAAALTTMVSGRLADYFQDDRYIVSLGYFIMGCGFFLFILVEDTYFLLMVQALLGCGEAIYGPAFDKLFSQNLDKGLEGSQWGGWEAAHYFVTAVGTLVGGFIANSFGFVTMFILMGVLCVVSGAYLLLLGRSVFDRVGIVEEAL